MNWSTAISAIGSSLGTAARAITPAIQAAFPVIAPLAVSALTAAPRTQHYSGGYGGQMAYRPTGFMPGAYGSQLTLPSLPGGAPQNPGIVSRGIDTLFGGPQAYPWGQSSLTTPTTPGARMPHLMQVPHARGDGSVVTYVRAPAVAYSVSIRRKGRRCHRPR